MPNKYDLLMIVSTVCLAVILVICGIAVIPKAQEDAVAATMPSTVATKPQQPETTQAITSAPTQLQPSETTQPTEQIIPIVFVSWPKVISCGETATVSICGAPDTVYRIQVYYQSGVSSAAGLEEQRSDENGSVTWSWKISKNARPGDYRIVVTGGGDSAYVEYSIIE